MLLIIGVIVYIIYLGNISNFLTLVYSGIALFLILNLVCLNFMMYYLFNIYAHPVKINFTTK